MEAWVAETFSKFAYQPLLVYSAICGFMLLSAFGLPIPEEMVLISAGLVGYMAMHPEKYPPPNGAATPVDVYILAAVAFTAVMGADYLIFHLGRRFGPKLFKTRWFSRFINEKQLVKIKRWMWEYGSWTVFIFRFTPGVRFPGHLSCGAMGLPVWKFLAVDWLAAGISVPTQVLLVSYYGEYILKYFTRFKIYFFSTLALIVISYVTVKYLHNRRLKQKGLMTPVSEEKNTSELTQTHPMTSKLVRTKGKS